MEREPVSTETFAQRVKQRMFRYTLFLATERRDAMMREGRAQEFDVLAKEVRAF